MLSQGLKTGMYYLRTKPAANPIQFTLDMKKLNEALADTSASEEGQTTDTPVTVGSHV